MSLDNLVRIGQLRAHTPSEVELARLLAAAERNLADAKVRGLSDETRFDAAYKAIMQCALVALMASGYRPSTSQPGHQRTMLQTLAITLALRDEEWVVLDALRRKRNASDYSGDPVEADAVRECQERAADLLGRVRTHLRQTWPEMRALSTSTPRR